MSRIAMRSFLIATTVIALGAVFANPARAEHGGCRNGVACQPYGEVYGGDLFYDYYSQGQCDRTANLYPSPLPTPPLAGRTYITYQPLMPHEYMYHHSRSYHSYYDGGKGLNRTLISYSCDPITATVMGIRDKLRIPR